MGNANKAGIEKAFKKFNVVYQIIDQNGQTVNKINVCGAEFTTSTWDSTDAEIQAEIFSKSTKAEIRKMAEFKLPNGQELYKSINMHQSLYNVIDTMITWYGANIYYQYPNYIRAMYGMHGKKYGKKIADMMLKRELVLFGNVVMAREALKDCVQYWCKKNGNPLDKKSFDDKISLLIKKIQEDYRLQAV